MHKLPSELAGLLRSEWEVIIEEAGFDEVEQGIVRDCFMDKYTRAYAATGVDRTSRTVSRRIPHIIIRAQEVAAKLNMI